MRLSTTPIGPATLAVVALVVTGCGGGGGGGGGSAGTAGAPCPAPAHAGAAGVPDGPAPDVARPVPKRDARELDRVSPADAALVSLLRAVEQGDPVRSAGPPRPAADERGPSCTEAAPGPQGEGDDEEGR